MDLFGFISLCGGLALFLYGMNLLGSGLERVSGGRMEHTLEKLTNNVLMAVALGALVTAAIQSSSATTVIVVGLVNAKVLKLRNAIGVIMGANIGTTVTAHILRLTEIQGDNLFLMLLKPTALAPMAAVAGILLFMSAKRSKQKDIGQILLGFGILFTGMFGMEAAVKPLAQEPWFTNLFATFENPIIGILVGAFVTAAIQSSSASVGILQAFSATGFLTSAMAFPIIMGQNIGTCITPILASIGAAKNAKRTACVHVCFNVLGTVIFTLFFYFWQYTVGFAFWELPIGKGGIANFHTLFNVVTTLLFIPLVGLLERLACALVRDKKDEADQEIEPVMLDERMLVSPGLAISHVYEATLQMGLLAQENFGSAVSLLGAYDAKTIERLNEKEDVVDKLQDRVEGYLLKLSACELTDQESRAVSRLLQVSGEFERIADHAQNLSECATRLYEDKACFSKKATEEMGVITDAVSEIISLAVAAFQTNSHEIARTIEPLEQIVDEIEKMLKEKHITRLRKGKCSIDAAFPFVEALSNLERISDHCSNVGMEVLAYDNVASAIDRHEYTGHLRKVQSEYYKEQYVIYTTKYFRRLKKKEA